MKDVKRQRRYTLSFVCDLEMVGRDRKQAGLFGKVDMSV